MSLIRRFPLSIAVWAIIIYLSFFRPPEVKMDTGWISLDKLAHLCMYGGWSLVIWLECWLSRGGRTGGAGRRADRRSWMAGLVLPVVVGGLIEIAQGTLTTHRSGDVDDFVANAVGAVIASLLATLWWRWKGTR